MDGKEKISGQWNMREIEVKAKVDSFDEIKKKLEDMGCVFSEPLVQHDIIYAEEGKEFLVEAKVGHRVVRLRRENGPLRQGVSEASRAIFNMKQQQSNELDSIEKETEVGDLDAMHAILLALGFRPEVEVKKKRLKTHYQEYEICLDEVEKLGTFIEVEKMTADEIDAASVQEELFTFLESLGVKRDQEQKRGYDTQIYKLEHQT